MGMTGLGSFGSSTEADVQVARHAAARDLLKIRVMSPSSARDLLSEKYGLEVLDGQLVRIVGKERGKGSGLGIVRKGKGKGRGREKGGGLERGELLLRKGNGGA